MKNTYQEVKEYICSKNIDEKYRNPDWIIILLNFNGLKELKYSIKPLLDTKANVSFKILVVDNGSIDSSWKYLKYLLKNSKIELMRLKKNYGWSEANNIAMKYMIEKYNPKFFTLANNDIVVHPDWLKGCQKVFKQNNKVGICSCNTYGNKIYVPYKIYLDAKKKYSRFNFKITQEGFGGMFFSIRTKIIKSLNFIDEGFLYFGEETDLLIRAKNQGIKIAVTNTPIWHSVSSTHKKNNFKASFHQMKAQLRLALKHGSLFHFFLKFLSLSYNLINPKKIKALIKTYPGAKRLIPSKSRTVNILILLFATIRVLISYPAIIKRILIEKKIHRKYSKTN